MKKKRKKPRRKKKQKRSAEVSLEVEWFDLDDISEAEYNPRKMTRRVVEDVKKSVMEFGYADPAVVNRRLEKNGWDEEEDGRLVMIGGHKRKIAVAELNEEHDGEELAEFGLKAGRLPCVIRELTESQEKALNIALNKIQDEFDLKLLAQVVEDIQKDRPELVTKMGFREPELRGLIVDTDIEAIKFSDVADEFLQSHPEQAEQALWLYCEPRTRKEFEAVKAKFGNPSNRMLDMDKLMTVVGKSKKSKKKPRRKK